MSHRIKFSDVRWFADRRPTCDVENQMKSKLGARDERDYSAKLQEQATAIYEEIVRKTPVVTIKDNQGSVTIGQ